MGCLFRSVMGIFLLFRGGSVFFIWSGILAGFHFWIEGRMSFVRTY